MTSPNLAKLLINLYPPYFATGIKVDSISADWKDLTVSMKLTWYNKNLHGTHFGGSLYAMVDPHLALMLIHILGEDYLVWDKSAFIDYIKPGKGKLYCAIKISDEQIELIKEKTKAGEKYFPEFELSILDLEKNIVANVKKTLYVRKKKV